MVLGREDVAAGPLHLEEPTRQGCWSQTAHPLDRDQAKPGIEGEEAQQALQS